ncbi:MAG: phosphoglucosamine mutase [Pseudomonadota bacterium]|nr:phosphoglucosamine mutase [Pseudomonadota bacterium]
MKRKYFFGTDGVRGCANKPPITAETTLKLGISAGHYFNSASGSKRVIIGKDTRRSGYMLENALTAGLTAVGMNVFFLGPVPTPAVGILTKSMRADVGIMISASHNPFSDNGIKFFGPDGFKLSEADELKIENLMSQELPLAPAKDIGRARRINDGLGRYTEAVKTTLPSSFSLEGFKIVIDCANGASYKAAPEILWELGADVVEIGTKPDGYNINFNCGSVYPEKAASEVLRTGADLGICLDGDADRVVLIDEKGRIANGDQLMAVIATHWQESGRLRGKGVVSTVMSNLGFEKYLNSKGLNLKRTPVGDRHVIAAMRKGNFNLGGEQSGHVILSDFMSTGDGLVAGLQFLASILDKKSAASKLLNTFKPYPQVVKSIQGTNLPGLLKRKPVISTMKEVEMMLGSEGRLFIRQSGTEPVIRVMVEHYNQGLVSEVVEMMSEALVESK